MLENTPFLDAVLIQTAVAEMSQPHWKMVPLVTMDNDGHVMPIS